LETEAEKLVEAREYNLAMARGRSQHGGRTRALDIAHAKLQKLRAEIDKKLRYWERRK